MNNIISFEEAKKKRLEKKMTINQVKENDIKHHFIPSKENVSFISEAKKFKFINMKQTAFLAIIDTLKVPPFYPPDPPPPMAA